MEQKKKQVRQPVVGTADSKEKAVQTMRHVDVFVSRLHPLTKEGELVECVNDENVNGDLKLRDVQCTKLKSRYEEVNSSMPVTIMVDAADFMNAVGIYMLGKAWPCGVFVRRYHSLHGSAALL